MKISDLTNTHSEHLCKGRVCVIHNPTEHHMIDWPIILRKDKEGLIERVCKHEVGHPDPDAMEFYVRIGHDYVGIHGCDGCCNPEDEKVVDDPRKNKMKIEPGQVWKTVDGQVSIVVDIDADDRVTYVDREDSLLAFVEVPEFRFRDSRGHMLIYPTPYQAGTFWSKGDDRIAIVTPPDSNGTLEVFHFNEQEIDYCVHVSDLEGYKQASVVW